ncbi:MAG: GntR family transcriptional regulator, arabinose operon transcriptional repressor [Halanaerobiales bacterium]|nr:GntR family transcriptional regulator, arabinose operon transcriptional repressor [Halanaerobiales bacterium]
MESNDLKRNSTKTLYQQIREHILDKIKRGIYKPGEAIPTERELCKNLDVSRYTVRRAIQELVHEGHLYRVQGSGTFVFDNTNAFEHFGSSIGVILTHCEHEMEANILSGIENIIQEKGFRMTFVSSHDDYQREAEYIHRMRLNGVKGLIIMPAEDQKESNAITDLKNEKFPFVLVDRRLQDCETDCVMSDNIDGGYKATEYLIEIGHTKIGFVKRKYSKTSSITDRIIGYKNALKEYGIEILPELIFSYDENLQEEEIHSSLSKYVKNTGVTAIVAINDYVALDIIKMSRKRNIQIPEELSLIGFDNLDFTKHLEVPLTTIAQSPKEIGEEAAKLLVEKINNQQGNNKMAKHILTQKYFPVDLIIRESCSPR